MAPRDEVGQRLQDAQHDLLLAARPAAFRALRDELLGEVLEAAGVAGDVEQRLIASSSRSDSSPLEVVRDDSSQSAPSTARALAQDLGVVDLAELEGPPPAAIHARSMPPSLADVFRRATSSVRNACQAPASGRRQRQLADQVAVEQAASSPRARPGGDGRPSSRAPSGSTVSTRRPRRSVGVAATRAMSAA